VVQDSPLSPPDPPADTTSHEPDSEEHEPPPPPSGTNSSGLPPSETSRYQLIAKNMDWKSASDYCHSKSARLVVISNAREQKALEKYLSMQRKFVCCWVIKEKKVNADLALPGEPHLRATGRHLTYGITQCYLLPDTSERAPPNPSQASWYSIYLPRRDGSLS